MAGDVAWLEIKNMKYHRQLFGNTERAWGMIQNAELDMF